MCVHGIQRLPNECAAAGVSFSSALFNESSCEFSLPPPTPPRKQTTDKKLTLWQILLRLIIEGKNGSHVVQSCFWQIGLYLH